MYEYIETSPIHFPVKECELEPQQWLTMVANVELCEHEFSVQSTVRGHTTNACRK